LEELQTEKKTELYTSALEDFLYNFIDKTSNQIENIESHMKLKDIPDVFAEMVKTQARLQNADKELEQRTKQINAEFYSLLNESMSSSDTPRLLTTDHVWKTIQDELKIILRDILGVTADDIITTTTEKKAPTTSNASAPIKGGLRFRFGTNFEVSAGTDEEISEKKDAGTAIFSSTTKPLTTFFSFTPYNMIWMFRLVRDFISTGQGMINTTTEDILPTLGDFMSDAVKQSLIPKVRSDYRGRLSKLLKEPDAFRPQEFIYTKVCRLTIF
jgi:hypothetical protein